MSGELVELEKQERGLLHIARSGGIMGLTGMEMEMECYHRTGRERTSESVAGLTSGTIRRGA